MRRNGKTTRLIDQAVQDLFNNGEVVFQDHYGTRDANINMGMRLLDRLEREHGLSIQRGNIKVDKDKFKITLVK